jgi:hypothetical protein
MTHETSPTRSEEQKSAKKRKGGPNVTYLTCNTLYHYFFFSGGVIRPPATTEISKIILSVCIGVIWDLENLMKRALRAQTRCRTVALEVALRKQFDLFMICNVGKNR